MKTPSTRIARPRSIAAVLPVALLALLAACASVPPPTEQMAVTTAALAQAVSAGAPELAPAEMNLARDKVARANTLLLAKDHEQALALLQQAQLDAQLAQAKAEAVKARNAADAVNLASQALREEMARKAAQQPKN